MKQSLLKRTNSGILKIKELLPFPYRIGKTSNDKIKPTTKSLNILSNPRFISLKIGHPDPQIRKEKNNQKKLSKIELWKNSPVHAT